MLKELVADPEAMTSAVRIQTQLRDMANRLKEISGRYALPNPQPGPISLSEMAVHLQSAGGQEAVQWEPISSSKEVKTDAALLARAFRELVENAREYSSQKRKPTARIDETADGAVIVLTEFGGPEFRVPELPFESPRANRYGAGLVIASSILNGLGHAVERKREGEQLETRISVQSA